MSVALAISFTSGGTHYTPDIDPRIIKVAGDVAISSNVDIHSITVEDEVLGIGIATGTSADGFVYMDDPLPILQKLFPDENISSFAVLHNNVEMPYALEDGKLRISAYNAGRILITGLSGT